MKKLHLISQNWRKEINTVACSFSLLKLIILITLNVLLTKEMKFSYSNMLLKKPNLHLYSILENVVAIYLAVIKRVKLLCWHSFCDADYHSRPSM